MNVIAPLAVYILSLGQGPLPLSVCEVDQRNALFLQSVLTEVVVLYSRGIGDVVSSGLCLSLQLV